MEKITITIPNKEENITLFRLTAAYVASQLNFDIETLEDLRVCVSEACNLQLGQSEELEMGIIKQKDYLEVIVEKEGEKKSQKEINHELAQSILEILMDEVNIDEKGVQLKKYLRNG